MHQSSYYTLNNNNLYNNSKRKTTFYYVKKLELPLNSAQWILDHFVSQKRYIMCFNLIMHFLRVF